jgi:hypothetical protein
MFMSNKGGNFDLLWSQLSIITAKFMKFNKEIIQNMYSRK